MTEKNRAVRDRLIVGGLLLLAGLGLIALTEDLGVVLGVVCLAGAAYQGITAAVAQGVKDGRES